MRCDNVSESLSLFNLDQAGEGALVDQIEGRVVDGGGMPYT